MSSIEKYDKGGSLEIGLKGLIVHKTIKGEEKSMKKRSVILAVLLCMCSVTTVYAENKLSVTKKNLIELEKNTGHFYAKVENTSDVPMAIGSGNLAAFNENDEILTTVDYVSAYPSGIVLNPGEHVYMHEYIFEDALEDNDIADYKFSIETRESGSEVERIPCEVSLDLSGADSYNNYIDVTFSNTGETVNYGYYISVALYDENDELIYVDGQSYENIGIHAGSTVTMKLYVDNDLLEYYNANSITPKTADAIVFLEKE